MAHFLPYTRQTIEDDDIAGVAAALRSEFLTTGPLVERFENEFAQATGAAHAVACNSGTAALHLAVLALRLGPGKAAVVPAITFLATANVVRMTGAEVVFADVSADTGLMTPEALDAAIRGAKARGLSPAAALPVHLGGQVCDMEGLANVARDAGVELVEDACHALGVEGIGAAVNARAACFSTHPAKAIATGEGGMVTTGDAEIAAVMRELRSHGMIRDESRFELSEQAFDDGVANPWFYEMQEIGWNYRLPDILCALGLTQLGKLDHFLARRREIADRYDRLVAPLYPLLRPVPRGNRPHGLHLYAVHIDFKALATTRARFMAALRAEGIGTQVHYIPLHWQPYYRRRYGDLRLPSAESYYERCLSIPLFPAMTDGEVDRVVATLKRLVLR